MQIDFKGKLLNTSGPVLTKGATLPPFEVVNAVEGVQRMQLLSDAAHQFGLAMGLYVPELGIDARSIWILDADGQVIYQELIKVQTNEPNYQAALDFLKSR